MKGKNISLLLALLLLGVFALAPLSASAARPTGSVTVPVTGTIANGGGTFSGAYTITRFASTSTGALNAIGTLSGTLTDPLGTVIGTVTNVPVTVPVTQATGSCTILDLTLGPLHLNLLGLIVDLNQVHLTITAQQGPGNLLGNLLCAIANLLNGGNPLGSLAQLLNQILAILGGL